jgi:hypothetical protein
MSEVELCCMKHSVASDFSHQLIHFTKLVACDLLLHTRIPVVGKLHYYATRIINLQIVPKRLLKQCLWSPSTRGIMESRAH